MRKLFLFFFLFSLIIYPFGCATYVKTRFLKPPEVNLGAIRKVAVLNFDFSGNIHIMGHGGWINYGSYSGKNITNALIGKLLNNQHYTVIEREELTKVLSEQSLAASGFIDSSEAIKLGKLFGVQALIIGQGNFNVHDEIKRTETYKEFTNRYEYYKNTSLERNASASITYRVINTVTGEIIATRTISDSKDSTVYAFPEKGTQRIQYKQQTPGGVYSNPFGQPSAQPVSTEQPVNYYDLNERINQLTRWDTLINNLVDNISQEIVYQIAPYYVTVEKEIKDGNSPEMKDAVTYAKNGLWASARDLWEKVVANSSPAVIKDHPAAHYNLGTYYEINGEIDKSEEHFAAAFRITKDKNYLKDIDRVQRRKKELAILAQQGRSEDLETNKNKGVDYLSEAQKYQKNGQYERAVNSYKALLQQEPSNTIALYNIAQIYTEHSMWNEALEYYQKTTHVNPQHAEAYYNMAKIYAKLDRMPESVEAFKLAFKYNPSLSGSIKPAVTTNHLELAVRYQNEGKNAEAVREYKEALKSSPKDSGIYNSIGILYYNMGNYNEAILYYKEAIKLTPADAGKYYNLAIVYHRLGKMPEAAEMYKKACSLGMNAACEVVKRL